MEKIDLKPAHDRELVLCRILDAPADKLYRAWTEPALVKQWFCPKPWSVSHAEMDVRAGGASRITMKGPEGQEMPNPGQYLEIIPNRKIVFTDAFTGDWAPKADAPFMVATITFEPQGGKTRYTARVQHWSVAAREQHEKMGFHEGWGKATEQLEALVRGL